MPRGLGGAVLACAFAGWTGCADVDAWIEGAPCPCATGYFCCELTETCLRDLGSCVETPHIDRVEPLAGPVSGGTRIRIVGRALGATTAVWIGDLACLDVEIRSEVEVECVVPPGRPGRFPVVVEAGETILEAGGRFEYVDSPFVERTRQAGISGPEFGLGVTLVDLERDGSMELFLSSIEALGVRWSTRAPLVFRLREEGVFEPMTEGLPEVAPHSGVAVAAIDGEPGLDWLLSRGDVTTLVTNASGELSAQVLTHIEEEGPHPPVFVDIDGDGDLDGVGCQRDDPSPGTKALVVLENERGRLASAPARVPGDLGLGECESIDLGDVDLDGDADVVVVGAYVAAFENQRGTFVEATEAWGLVPPAVPMFTDLQLVDLDLDGDLDLVASPRVDWSSTGTFRRRGLLVWLNRLLETGEVTFEPAVDLEQPGPRPPFCTLTPELWPNAALDWGGDAVLWFDADHDTDLDGLVFMPSSKCALGPALYRSRVSEGELAFVIESLPAESSFISVTGAAAGDVDRDGDIDAVAHAWGAGQRAFLENVADVIYSEAHWLIVQPLSDLDGDATDSDEADDFLVAAARVEIDFDGPDFIRGQDRISIRTTGAEHAMQSQAPNEAHFGLGAHDGPLWVRVFFADGSVATRRVDALDRVITIKDCAASTCP